MVKIETGAPKYDPNEYRHLPPRDWLGDRVSRTHRVVAQLASPDEKNRNWEIQCERCRFSYLATDAAFANGGVSQPCKCTMRNNR